VEKDSLLLVSFDLRFFMQHIASHLEKIVARNLRQAQLDQAPLLAWPLACGSTVACRTRSLDFTSGVLRVEVPDAGWKSELQSLAPQYLAVINRFVSARVVRIEFVPVAKQSSASRPNMA
jgi:hypothetical protein